MVVNGPQVEDGHVRIANELYDEILRAPFSKRELLVVLALIRKTYGFSKHTDDITYVQVSKMTGIDRANVNRTVLGLVKKRVVLKRHGRYGQTLGINKHYYQWVGMPKRHTRAKTTQEYAKTASTPCQNDTIEDANLAYTTDNPNKHSQQTPPLPPTGGARDILDEYPKRLEPINPIAASIAYGEALRTHTHEQILAAVKRYAAFCDRDGRIGTKFVMTPQRFFTGPENIESEWKGEEGESALDDETRRRLAAHA